MAAKRITIVLAVILLVSVLSETGMAQPTIDGILSPGEWDFYYLGSCTTNWEGGMIVDVYGYDDGVNFYAAYEADTTQPGWAMAKLLCIGPNFDYKTPATISWPDPGYTHIGYPGDGYGRTDGSDWIWPDAAGNGDWNGRGIEFVVGHPCGWSSVPYPVIPAGPQPNVAEIKIPLSQLKYAGSDGTFAISGQYWQYDWCPGFFWQEPCTVYVNQSWTSQEDVDLFDPSLTWQDDAFDVIQDGLDAACNGGLMIVYDGTYLESGLAVTQAGLTIRAGSLPVLDGGGGVGFLILANNVTVQDFEFINCNPAIQVGQSGTTVSGFTVHDCFFSGNAVAMDVSYHTGTDDAENNWWGSCTGPQHDDNPQGTGEPIIPSSASVDFDPWLFPCSYADHLPAVCLDYMTDDLPDQYLIGSNDPTGDWWAVAFYNPGGVAKVSSLSFRFWDPGTIRLYVFSAGDSLPEDGLCASGLLVNPEALLGDSLAPGAERSFLGLGLTQWEERELSECVTVGSKSWFVVAWQKRWDEYPRIIGDNTGGAGSHSWIWNAELGSWKCFPNLEYAVKVCLEYDPDCVTLIGAAWSPDMPCICENYEVGAFFTYPCTDGDDKELLVSFWNAPFGLFTLPGPNDLVCPEETYNIGPGEDLTAYCNCQYHHDADSLNFWARNIAVRYNPDVNYCMEEAATVYRYKRFPTMTIWPDQEYDVTGTYGPIPVPIMNDEGNRLRFDVAIEYSGDWTFRFTTGMVAETLWLDPQEVDTLYLMGTNMDAIEYAEQVLVSATKCNGEFGQLWINFMPYTEPVDMQPVSLDSLRISRSYPCEDSTRFDVGVNVINDGDDSAYPHISFGIAQWGFFFEAYAQYDTVCSTGIGAAGTLRVEPEAFNTPFFLWDREGLQYSRNVLIDYRVLKHHCETVDSVEVAYLRDCRRIIWPGHRWPWDGDVIPLPVYNEENFEDTIELSVETMPAGWLWFLSKSSFTLAPGAADTAYLSVIPQGSGPPVPPNHVAAIRAVKGFCDQDTAYCYVEFLPYACVCIPDYLGKVVENLPGQHPVLVPGDTVAVNIMLENDIDVTGVGMYLDYDEDYLLPDTTRLTPRSAGMYLNEGIVTDGTYSILIDFRTGPSNVIEPSPPQNHCEQKSAEDALKFATVYFIIIDDPRPGTCTNITPMDVVVMGLPDADDEPKDQICACENHGQICFGGYKFPMKCDVNEDSTLTLLDIFLILMHIVRIDTLEGPVDVPGTPLWGADANGDQAINILDLMKCINKSVGVIDPKLSVPVADAALPASMDVMAGRGVELPLDLTADRPLSGILYRLRFDSNLMNLDKPELTERSAAMSLEWGVVGDETWVLLYSMTGNVIGAGTGSVVNLPFRVTDGADGEWDLDFEQSIVFLADERIVFSDQATVTMKTVSLLPTEFSLSQNYPNPFNPETEIRYGLPEEAHVRLEIYNVLGQRVLSLVNEKQEAGYRTVTWNGRDETGREVSSGVYFYRMTAGTFTSTRQMVLMK